MGRRLKRIIRALIHGLVRFLGERMPASTGQDAVVIIRNDAIGDFVIFRTMLNSLLAHYRAQRIVLVVQESVAALAAVGGAAEIIAYHPGKYRKNPIYRLGILNRIRRVNSRRCINTVYSRSLESDEMVLWSRAAERLGWNTLVPNMTDREKRGGDVWYTGLAERSVARDVHETRIHEWFLEWLGVPVVAAVGTALLKTETGGMEAFWRTPGLAGKDIVAIIPGSLVAIKEWPAGHFIRLMDMIADQCPETVFVLVGGGKDRKSWAAHAAQHKARVINLCGKTKLSELTGVFAKCRLVVGNDTGPMHLAMASGAPTVCFLGGGHFGRFFPYGNPEKNVFLSREMDCYWCNWQCRYALAHCIADVTPETALDACLRLMR